LLYICQLNNENKNHTEIINIFMKRISFKTSLFVLLAAIALTSCYKSGDDVSLDELDVTLTYYDTNFDYSTYNTFYVRDSVILTSNYLSKSEIADFYKNGTSNKIRSVIIQKFESLGYTYVNGDEGFDFAINPLISLTQTSGASYYPGYWWGPGYWDYWGWYGGSGGYWGNYWGYPGYGGGWYPWGWSYYSYESGTCIMEMVDGNSLRTYRQWMIGKTPEQIKNADPKDVPSLKFVWHALIEGVAGSSSEYNSERAQNGFDEAFEQSPYLHKN